MYHVLNSLRRRAAEHQHTIVLPETGDARVLRAAVQAWKTKLCRPLLVGSPEDLADNARAAEVDLPDDLPQIDPTNDSRRQEMLDAMVLIGKERGVLKWDPEALLEDPLYFANLLVRTGRAHGAVMGAVATTGETLKAALRVSGVHPEHQLVTSCFLMVMPDGTPLVYSDCGVVPKPTGEQLATIAVLAAQAYRILVDDEPRVALLSFSTHGSARHESLDHVLEARDLLLAQRRDGRLDFEVDGELQGDAALIPSVAQRKAPDSSVAGRANVMVFPDLNSGNIAYKLTERLAGARAIGPLLRGLAFPIHDLSRGCSVEDLIDTMAITALEPPSRQLKGGSE